MTQTAARVLTIVLLMASVAPALAQQPKGSESGSQSSNMGLPPADPKANNGAGTDGSLTGNNGTASSTVQGIDGGQTPTSSSTSSQGSNQAKEREPAQGGGKQDGAPAK